MCGSMVDIQSTAAVGLPVTLYYHTFATKMILTATDNDSKLNERITAQEVIIK